jgi:cytochrome c-type biogenesis protein CcmH/NrfG
MRFKFIPLLAIILASAAAGTASAQGGGFALKGQLFLPGGGMPTHEVRMEIENDLGYHDTIYTDSNGRFLLDSLTQDVGYTILIQSDGEHWGDTKYQFTVQFGNGDARITLSPMPRNKEAKPDVISAVPVYKPDPKAVALRDQGMKASQAGKSEDAEALLRQAIAADPKYSAAYYDLGTVLMHERKFADAEAAFQKGTVADPKSPRLFMALGTALVSEGKFADAVAPLREALRLQPDQADAELQLGAALVETKQLDDAETQLLAAQKTKGETDVRLELYLGKLYLMKKDYPKSIEAFNLYLKLAPENSPNSAPIRNLIQSMQDELNKKNDH